MRKREEQAIEKRELKEKAFQEIKNLVHRHVFSDPELLRDLSIALRYGSRQSRTTRRLIRRHGSEQRRILSNRRSFVPFFPFFSRTGMPFVDRKGRPVASRPPGAGACRWPIS